MSLEVKLTPKLTYKLRLSPRMRLSLNILHLPLAKLKEYVIEEIEKNPILEPLQDNAISSRGKLDTIVKDIESRESEQYKSDVPWTEEDESSPCVQGLDEEKKRYRESLITASLTLQEHLLKQLHLLANSDDECKIGELIIGNIDDNGYLRYAIEDIAESIKTTKSQVEKVLSLIQTFDPVGIGARDLRECLLLQLKAKGEENSLAGKIVDIYLPFLEKKRYGYIAKKLKVSVEKIKEAIKEIARLEPKPGGSFNREESLRLVPDAILKRNKDGYEIILNDWELPSVRINDKYKKMLKEKDVSMEVKEYLQERFNAAKVLIDAIGKRRQTIQKVVEDIVHFQKDCMDKELGNFKPMTLSQVAERIGKHKSTVSRAIANKYLQTPYGIVELRHFLNSGIKQENGELYSSKNVKLKISDLIRNEDKNKPLSDQDIVNLFRQDGIFVSRRTITKYRTQLKIPPSQLRKM